MTLGSPLQISISDTFPTSNWLIYSFFSFFFSFSKFVYFTYSTHSALPHYLSFWFHSFIRSLPTLFQCQVLLLGQLVVVNVFRLIPRIPLGRVPSKSCSKTQNERCISFPPALSIFGYQTKWSAWFFFHFEYSHAFSKTSLAVIIQFAYFIEFTGLCSHAYPCTINQHSHAM